MLQSRCVEVWSTRRRHGRLAYTQPVVFWRRWLQSYPVVAIMGQATYALAVASALAAPRHVRAGRLESDRILERVVFGSVH